MLSILQDIDRPTEMQCKFNSTKCRLLKLTDYYAEVDSKTIEGPYVIQRISVNKTFDYDNIVKDILKPNSGNILLCLLIYILL